MKLPYQMAESVDEAILALFETNKISTPPQYAVFFVKACKDEKGHPIMGSIQPRYVIIYSASKEELNKAVFHIEKLFGSAIDYEVEKSGIMPESHQSVEEGFVLLHRRSRAREAEVINDFFTAGKTDELWNMLLKSTFTITITEQKNNGMSSYTAKTSILPSTADLIADSGILSYPSSIEAVEKVIGSPHCDYEKVVDLNFDNCMFDFSPLFKGEFDPLTTNAEIVKLFRMNILAALSGNKQANQKT